MRYLIAALIAGVALIGSPVHAAPAATFTVPDIHVGDSVTVVARNDSLSVFVRCDGTQGHYEQMFTVVNNVAVLGPFVVPPWPQPDPDPLLPTVCSATLGAFKGNHVWRETASDDFTISNVAHP